MAANRPPWTWNGSFGDFESANDAIQGFGLDWLQLDRGPTELRFRQIGLPNVLFSRLSVTRKYHQRGVIPEGTWSFALIGRAAPNLEWHGEKATASHILLYPRHDEYQLVTHPGNHGDVVSVPDASVRSIAERLGLPDPAEKLPTEMSFLEVGGSRTESIRQTLNELHSAPQLWLSSTSLTKDRARFEEDLVGELLVAVFASAADSQRLPTRSKQTRALHLALEFIECNADAPPSIAQMCSAAGVSWRTLNYAFQERFGLTPKQYLQAVRLQGVRRQLLRYDGSTTVSEAAARWGFWHLGRFAAEYRKFFGELPSETLVRRFDRSSSG